MATALPDRESTNDEVTPEMIEAAARALRAYSQFDERMGESESLYLAEKALEAAFTRSS
jgi:hypothetical protein